MSFKKLTNISALLILPILLASFGSSMSSLTRVYVSSGGFVMSILFGALVTSGFYAQDIKNNTLRRVLIFIFGILAPILYIQSASEIFGSGYRMYSELWSPIYLATTVVGLIEIILYIGILITLFMTGIKSVVISFVKIASKMR